MFEFELVFALPDGYADANTPDLLDRLFEAGLDDAVIGTGAPGMIGVSLGREGENLEAVVAEAVHQCMRALPDGSVFQEMKLTPEWLGDSSG